VFASLRERRIRNRLLMRELLLRLEAERVRAVGKSGSPTVYFRGQKRRLLLSNPLFALRYIRATKRSRPQPSPTWQQRVIEAQLSESRPARARDLPT
jgi:hypothetical protein